MKWTWSRKERTKTHNLILNTICLSPSTHNPSIVKGNDSHEINTLVVLQCRQLLDETREMAFGAARGESSRDRDEDDFLASEFCCGKKKAGVRFMILTFWEEGKKREF